MVYRRKSPKYQRNVAPSLNDSEIPDIQLIQFWCEYEYTFLRDVVVERESAEPINTNDDRDLLQCTLT